MHCRAMSCVCVAVGDAGAGDCDSADKGWSAVVLGVEFDLDARADATNERGRTESATEDGWKVGNAGGHGCGDDMQNVRGTSLE